VGTGKTIAPACGEEKKIGEGDEDTTGEEKAKKKKESKGGGEKEEISSVLHIAPAGSRGKKALFKQRAEEALGREKQSRRLQ